MLSLPPHIGHFPKTDNFTSHLPISPYYVLTLQVCEFPAGYFLNVINNPELCQN